MNKSLKTVKGSILTKGTVVTLEFKGYPVTLTVAKAGRKSVTFVNGYDGREIEVKVVKPAKAKKSVKK